MILRSYYDPMSNEKTTELTNSDQLQIKGKSKETSFFPNYT